MSNITVSVAWERPTIFAGEEIQCTIVFRNDAVSGQSALQSPVSLSQSLGTGRDRWKLGLLQSTASELSYKDRLAEPQLTRSRNVSHRSTISLNAPVGTPREGTTGPPRHSPSDIKMAHKHNRSVSIISIGSQPGAEEEHTSVPASKHIRGVQKTHGRSASFQGLPRRSAGVNAAFNGVLGGQSPSQHLAHRSSTSPFPLQRSTTLKSHGSRLRDLDEQIQSTETFSGYFDGHTTRQGEKGFDHQELGNRGGATTRQSSNADTQKSAHSTTGAVHGSAVVQLPPHNRRIQRVLSPTSMEGTPRSSMDLYTQSNGSSETLASEYVMPSNPNSASVDSRLHGIPYVAAGRSPTTLPETLMMGYVQLMGSCTFDGSLVTTAPFDSVKRKGVIGGQGSGGVVGLSKRESGLFGSLGWSNIGQSLGGLLGSQDPSSIREMKGIAGSKAIPILSTPQSILFVDLKLRPGESKTFSYKYQLPDNVPPTHKGRAFKSSYQLVIGVQRARSSDRQHIVRQVDVPFKVLPSVNRSGDISTYDLMKPHILLRDMALTQAIQDKGSAPFSGTSKPKQKLSSIITDDGFADYVERLLFKSRQDSNLSLLSPTEPASARELHSFSQEEYSVKDMIDAAIIRAHSSTQKSSNRFQIHQDGAKVANVVLPRSAYRLGESIPIIIDFSNSDMCCFAVDVLLESSEIVDETIALRSAASIHRATRRIHAHCSENTVSAQKLDLSLTIPFSATPEFHTSGVHLNWKLRFEFITSSHATDSPAVDDLLEHVSEDERGTTSAAIQEIPCQSFDVNLPVKIYGSIARTEEDIRPSLFPV